MSIFTARQRPLQPEVIHRTIPGAAEGLDGRSRLMSVDWLACLLFSLLQLLWAGYRLGAGNQSIQIPFLANVIDPSLYPRDAMVQETLSHYPSFFFRILAWAIPVSAIAPAYFVLHLLTSFAVFAATFWLAQSIFNDRRAGYAGMGLLLAGHNRALGGADL